MKTLVFSILISVLLLTACSRQPSSFIVNGTLADSTYHGKTAYLFDRNSNSKLDSILVEGNSFSFRGKQAEPTYALVSVEKLRLPFMLENGIISLDASRPGNPQGSPLNQIFSDLLVANDSLETLLSNEREKIYAQTEDQTERAALYGNYVDNQWNTLFAQAIEPFFTQNQSNDVGTVAFQLLGYVYDEDRLDSLLNSSSDYLKSREPIKKTSERILALKNTKVGMPFVDFSVEQEDGQSLALSEFVGKGKYALVDFWASWCGPCRREIPIIAEVYKEYGKQGLEVLSVAVWEEPAQSREGIANLQMDWHQIVNAQDIPSALYGFAGIPHIILFGPDGSIVARDLRGDGLKAKIKEVFTPAN